MDANSCAGLAKPDAVGRVLDEAQKQIRDGDVDPKLLKDLGMTAPQFKSFVEKYSQKFEQVRKVQQESGQCPDQQVTGAFVAPGSDHRQGGPPSTTR